MESNERKNPKIPNGNKLVLIRTVVLMCLCGIVLFVPLFIKLWDIAVTNHAYYEDLAISQQTRDVTVSASRGTIYDCNGDVLAISATVYNLILSPRDVIASVSEKDYATEDEYNAAVAAKQQLIIEGICSLTGADKDDVTQRMGRTDSAYQIVYKDIEDNATDAIRTFITDNKLASCLYLTPTTKRYYPHSELAAQVIGFTNSDGGAYGIELQYNSELSGTVGRVVTTKNAKGTEMLDGYSDYVDAVNGDDVYLSIDSTIQYYAEEIVQEGIKLYDVQNGATCIVMDPNTGAVLADVSYPEFDPNDPSAVTDSGLLATLSGLTEGTDAYNEALTAAQFKQWRNKGINDAYEPGSTFKSVVLSAALEENVVNENSQFYCPGYYVVNGTTLHCADKSGHGSENLVQGVMNSCNPVFMQVGQKLGAETFYKYFTDFGLTAATGIDLPGEQTGTVWTKGYFTSAEGYLSLATASFGQRFTVTPIQMLTAFAATINGGYLLQPYVVQKVTDSAGNLVSQTQKNVVRQVVSESTSQRVCSMLEKVVSEGTGHGAYVAGYRIGGKTGTAETSVDGEYVVSFVGFAPADDPQVIVLLAYDTPQPAGQGSSYSTTGYYISGGAMVAPMVGRLVQEILDYTGFQKEYTASEADLAEVTVKNLTGLSLTDAKAWLSDKGLECEVKGSGETVTGQIPVEGASIPGGSTVVLYCGEEVPTDAVTVPDVTGMTLSQARAAMAKVDLYIQPVGASSYSSATLATSQAVTAGESVARGSVISVTFADNTIPD